MKEWQLRLYHRLPHAGRQLLAGLRGYYLERWRYGSESPRWVDEALSRERWPFERWQEWQEQRLRQLLQRAVRDVPHYRGLAAAGQVSKCSPLESWPVLNKEQLRSRPEDFLADDCDPRSMFREQTSGTTGTPLRLYWSRETTRRWYSLHRARLLSWNGVGPQDRWGLLGGQLVVAPQQKRPPFWVWNRPMRQLYLSAYHLSEENAAAYLEALRRYRVAYLVGYPSGLAALAGFALEAGLEPPRMKVALSQAEPVLELQRQAISSAFRCPVREAYGLAEIVCAASECQAGALHLWPEVGRVEILADDEDRRLPPGERGRLVCTGLLNVDMPLIRYDTGDRARLEPRGLRCDCGRTLPVIGRLEGRSDDVVVTPEGRRVGRLDPVFKADLPIREAQIVQEDRAKLLVRVVPAEGFAERHAAEILHRLAERVGESMELRLEQVQQIERGAAGKFRAVISRLGSARGDSSGVSP